MESNRLQIRRLRAEYLVPAEHPSPERVKARLDKTLIQQLEGTLSSALSTWFSESDESIWFVRRLEIDVAVNASWNGEQVTRVFTKQIGRTLGATLQESAEKDNVVRFPNRRAYLARFLCDLAAGHAWSHWYYESFSGLRMLPTSAALRTAICDRSEPGREALLLLSSGELQEVLRALGRHDAELVLDNLAAMVAAGDEVECCQLAWNAWLKIEPDSFDRLDDRRRALLLYLTASRDQDGVGLNLKRASLSLVRLASRLATDSKAQSERLVSSLTGGSLAEFYRAAGADVEVLSPLLRCSTDWLRDVAEKINTRPEKQTSDEQATPPGRRYTSFGGAFLLLPFIDSLPLMEATRDWPHTNEAAAISLVRWLLLLKCCGGQNAQRSFNDALLRDLLFIPPAVSEEAIREWQSGVAPAQVLDFLKTLLEWQRTEESVTGNKLILARTLVKERPVVVLIDGARGLWVMAHASEPDSLMDQLREWLTQLESDDGVMLCEASLLEALWPKFPGVKMLSLADVGSEDDEAGRIIARLDRLPDEFAHLALPEAFQLSPEFDLALSLVAQHIMRSFARELSGFAPSNLLYLWSNFLDFPASLDEEPDRRVVCVGRPPLRLVLGLSGLTRQSYRLSWLDERPLSLFEES